MSSSIFITRRYALERSGLILDLPVKTAAAQLINMVVS